MKHFKFNIFYGSEDSCFFTLIGDFICRETIRYKRDQLEIFVFKIKSRQEAKFERLLSKLYKIRKFKYELVTFTSSDLKGDKTCKGFYIKLNSFWKQDHCFEFLTASLKLTLNHRSIRGMGYYQNKQAYDKFMSGKSVSLTF